MTPQKQLGNEGEALAAAYYEAQGFTVLARNFRTRQGEIDLIVRRGPRLVFAEVKARADERFSAPCEAVTAQKQRRIIAAAKAYLARCVQEDLFARFDVVEVVQRPGAAPAVRCIEDAFSL